MSGKAKFLGQITDPHTGERVDVYANGRIPTSHYKTWRGGRAQMPTTDSLIYELHFVGLSPNPTIYTEERLDSDGWWVASDWTYMPNVRRGPVARFFINLGAGLSEGYPLLDVVAFSARHFILGIRARLRRSA